MTETGARPLIVGPETPEAPFPIVVHTEIQAGFGRGSSELGIPTVNIPPQELAKLDTGVYYGWCRVAPLAGAPPTVTKACGERRIEFNFGTELTAAEQAVFPMVMSLGWNPHYANKEKSAEIHILHEFAGQFYGAAIGVVVAGYIRNERKYDSLQALIDDINMDIRVARHSIERPKYVEFKNLLSEAQ